MSRISDKMDALRRVVEIATGSIRQVAQHLDEIADTLPQRDRSRRLALNQQADRLRAAADLLTAECNVGDVRNVRRVATVAGAALVAVGVIAQGAAEGGSAALVERALTGQREAATRVDVVAQHADAVSAEKSQAIREEINDIRSWLFAMTSHPVSGLRSPESVKISDRYGLTSEDWDMRDLRQRVADLLGATEALEVLAIQLADRGHALAASRLEQIHVSLERLRDLRQQVELLPPEELRGRQQGQTESP